MIVELHMLQNFAPSCLNRDDTNSPKDCEFGGVRRARISSQCIKRAVRRHPTFCEKIEGIFAKRSNQHARAVAQRITDRTNKPLEETIQVARYLFQQMGFKEKQGRLTAMLFLGDDEINLLAEEGETNWDMLSPLANETILWELLANRLAKLLNDMSEDAEMFGRLIANHRAGTANASVLQKWNVFPDEKWEPAIDAVRKIPDEVRKELRAIFEDERDSEEEDEGDKEYVPKKAATLFNNKKKNEAVVSALKNIHLKQDKGTARTAEEKENRKEAKKQLNAVFAPLKKLKTKAVDVAMFGRMLAEITSGDMNVDAACQVAHAISTNKLSAIEFDFFTAVEELKDLAKEQGVEQSAGAGMMGSTEFNSACYYRYANVDTEQLAHNLLGKNSKEATEEDHRESRELAKQAVEAFLRASIEAIPTGKQNSMAAQNAPSLVFAVVRKSGFWSLANAFERPVMPDRRDDGLGLVAKSIQALDCYWIQLSRMYGPDSIIAGAACKLDQDIEFKGLKKFAKDNLDNVVKNVLDALTNGRSN